MTTEHIPKDLDPGEIVDGITSIELEQQDGSSVEISFFTLRGDDVSEQARSLMSDIGFSFLDSLSPESYHSRFHSHKQNGDIEIKRQVNHFAGNSFHLETFAYNDTPRYTTTKDGKELELPEAIASVMPYVSLENDVGYKQADSSNPQIAEISLTVADDSQGRGIGFAITVFSILKAKDLGINYFYADILNNPASGHIFKKLVVMGILTYINKGIDGGRYFRLNDNDNSRNHLLEEAINNSTSAKGDEAIEPTPDTVECNPQMLPRRERVANFARIIFKKLRQ